MPTISALVRIHVATIAQRAELEELQRRASLNNSNDRAALLANPDAIALPDRQFYSGHVFAAQTGDAVAGFAAVDMRADGALELDGLFVEPSAWRQGIGRALIEYCCEFAHLNKAPALMVVGNPHAKGFYEACGFIMTGTHETRFGTGLLMERPL